MFNPYTPTHVYLLHASIFYFIFYIYSVLLALQRRAPDPIIDGKEQLCGYGEWNSGPLEVVVSVLNF